MAFRPRWHTVAAPLPSRHAPLHLFLVVLAVASTLLGAWGCTKSDPPQDDILALPADTTDIAPLDADRVAILRGDREKAVSVVSVHGETLAQFEVPPQTIALGYAGPDAVLDVIGGPHGVVELRGVGGGTEASIPVHGRVVAVAGIDAKRAFALIDGRPQTIDQLDFNTSRIVGKTVAPRDARSLAALPSGPDSSLLVGTSAAQIYERIPGATNWQRLPLPGTNPAYSFSGSAIYAFQTVGATKAVAVVVRPYLLQVRLFPVSFDAVNMRATDDGTLVIYERTAKAANMRLVPCGSPLLAVEPLQKRNRFFGGGAPWQLLGHAGPDPASLQATPLPEPTAGISAGC